MNSAGGGAVEYRLSELMICAASEVWRDDGEILASGMGLLQRLAASLSMLTSNPDLLMTDSEAFMVSEPVPVGPRDGYAIKAESWMGFSRMFDTLWGGGRHALVGPTQIDRYGQSNISCIGDHDRPKVQMLGVRGYPGNSISHRNSFFVTDHSTRVFVSGEVDMVSSVGYNPARLSATWLQRIRLGLVITNLCIMDFGGPNHQLRVLSLHPGVQMQQVLDNTGFDLCSAAALPETPAPTTEQLAIIQRMDPHNLRSGVLRGDPPGNPSLAVAESGAS